MTFYQMQDKESGNLCYWDNDKKHWYYALVHEVLSDALSPIENMNEAFKNADVEYFIVNPENLEPVHKATYDYSQGWSKITDMLI